MTASVKVTHLAEMTSFPVILEKAGRKWESISVSESRNLRYMAHSGRRATAGAASRRFRRVQSRMPRVDAGDLRGATQGIVRIG